MTRWVRALALGMAATAAGAAAVLLLHLAAAPIRTADFWWHLKQGELFAGEGLALESDPLSHTARGATDPHEWLFQVGLYRAYDAIGFQGLRVLHALAALAILALVLSLSWRESRSAAAACLVTTAFVVLTWYRVTQLRPDLWSLLSALLLYRLLLERGGPPEWPRVGAAAALFALWVNAHSLFAVGLALLVAALVGVGVRAGAARLLLAGAEQQTLRNGETASRLAAALAIAFAATLANPQGIEAHLTFFRASSGLELWRIGDEWTPFDAFGWTRDPGGMSRLTWYVADATLAAFAVAALAGGVALLRRRSAAALRRVDPVLFGLGAAGVVALLVSQRFVWLLVFPLLFVLRGLAPALAARAPRAAGLEAALALASVALVISLPRLGGMQRVTRQLPQSPSAYLATPWLARGYHVEGVRFLRETGLEGRLFNEYAMGGFLTWWVGPRLQTFIDGRLNIRADVMQDYFAVVAAAGAPESWLEVLERREVDVFFGVGAPTIPVPGRRRTYTTAHLESAPGWVLVWRSLEHAIYLRRNERNRENLERVRAYYEGENVPFDPDRGLSPGLVVRARPEWAVAHGMLPSHYARVRAAADGGPRGERRRALELLAFVHALLGSYPDQIGMDRELAALRPAEPGPQRRLVNGLVREERGAEAVASARQLSRLEPNAPRTRPFVEVARELVRLQRRAGRNAPSPALLLAPALSQLPLVNPADLAKLRRRFVEPRLEAERATQAAAAPGT